MWSGSYGRVNDLSPHCLGRFRFRASIPRAPVDPGASPMTCVLLSLAGVLVVLLLLIVVGGCIEAWYPPPRDGGRW